MAIVVVRSQCVLLLFGFMSLIGSGNTLQECGTPVDCVVSEWNHWSECSQSCGENGSRTRSRVLFQDAMCGGTCPFDTGETESCNRKCCPVDCTFTLWTQWASCSCTADGCEGAGERQMCRRTRKRLTDAACGGYCDKSTTQKKCGDLCCQRHCVLGLWTSWSECDAQCEQQGTKRRTREIIQDAACGGRLCGKREDFDTCTGKCCPVHCELGDWSDWSNCNNPCGQGTQTRQRFVQLPQCDGDPCTEEPHQQEVKICTNYVNVDCEMSPWTAWSKCYLYNGFCGDGTKSRTRSVLNQSTCNGQKCGNLRENGICYGKCCRKDCKVSIWSEWGFCSSTCGQGVSGISNASYNSNKHTETMFRNFYAEQEMTDPRDSWYQPNLLYNIHYRPPKPQAPPKMMVVTKKFNPSVCTCGQHGCKPHYRMEREVVWSDRETKSKEENNRYIIVKIQEEKDVKIEKECEDSSANDGGGRNDGAGAVEGKQKLKSDASFKENADNTEEILVGKLDKESGQSPCNTFLKGEEHGADKFETQSGRLHPESNGKIKVISELKQRSGSLMSEMVIAGPEMKQSDNDTIREYERVMNHNLAGVQNDPECDEEMKLETVKGDDIGRFEFIDCLSKKGCFNDIIVQMGEKKNDTAKLGQNSNDVGIGRKMHRSLSRTEQLVQLDSPNIGVLDIQDSSINLDLHDEDFGSAFGIMRVYCDSDLHAECNRTRSVESWPSCGGTRCPSDLIESRGCLVTEVANCDFTEWSNWTSCSNKCGSGVITRRRQMTSPAYCDGTCESVQTYEEMACESYSYRQNCKVSDWSGWSTCIRSCEGGMEYRTRSLVSNPVCGGTLCPNLTESRSCQERCEQICNDGICGCETGFRMNVDNVTCSEITCPQPETEYCPPTHRRLTDCRYPKLSCLMGYTFNQTCTAFCEDSDWVLKGSPKSVTCLENSSWTEALIYCVRPNKPPLGIMIDRTEIEENTPKDNCFANLTTLTLENETSTFHSYTITRDDTGRFCIKENRVCLTRMANFEEKPDRWNVTFRSSDFEGEFVEETFTFNVLDANGPPSSVKLEPDTLPENSPAGTVVGCFVGTDDDPGQTLTFTLINSPKETFTSFEENGQTCLKVLKESQPLCATDGGTYCTLNRERKLEHWVTVQVTDDGTPAMSALFEVPIYLSDVDDRQTDVQIIPDKLPENVPAGEKLVQFMTVDEDENQTYTYRIVSDASGLFSITGDNLYASRSFDYETEPDLLLEIEVESTDDASPPLTIISVIKLKIQDIDESPFQLQVSSLKGVYPFSLNTPRVPENLQGILGTVMVKDHDLDDVVEITFGGKDTETSNLILSPSSCSDIKKQMYCTATISIQTAFNYEEEKRHNFSLVATDKAGEHVILNVSLEVLNTNDPPSILLINNTQLDEIAIPENKQNLRIGVLSAIDDDKNDKHEFKLVDSALGTFLLERNVLKTSKSSNIDYERQGVYRLVIAITDDGKPRQTSHVDLTVRIVDVNEIPTSTLLSNRKVMEKSPEGEIVGELTTTDPDNIVTEKQRFMYTLSDDSQGRFKLNGSTLMVRESPHLCGISTCKLDYEEQQTLTVTIITIDDGEPRMQREDRFVIDIEDDNDPPTDITIDASMIKENNSPGTHIGTISAWDVDGGKLTYTLKIFDDVFEIQDGNKLVSMISLDYEKLNNYRVVVLAEDDGNPPAKSEETLMVHVVDVNEQPGFINVSKTLAVRKDTAAGDIVKTYAISDPDTDEDLAVSITDTFDIFSISSPTCETKSLTGATECTVHIILMSPLDNIKTEPYNINLSVTDKGGRIGTATVGVIIEDVNIKPTDITLDDISTDEIPIKENTISSEIAKLAAVDKDSEQKHTFMILSNPNAFFEIDENMLKSKPDADIDFETLQANMTLEIEITDSGKPPLSFRKLWSVIVQDVNEIPTGITLSSSQIAENSATGTVIGTIDVTDPDFNQSHRLILVNDGNGRFLLEGNMLKVADSGIACVQDSGYNCKINYEEMSKYNLSVEVIDSGWPPLVALFSVIVEVTDVNEKPRNIKISENKLQVGSPAETLIGILSVEDEDKSQMHTFELVEASQYVKVRSTGQVTLKGSQNLNENQIIDLTIKATDDGTPPMFTSEIVRIIVIGEDIMTVTLEAVGDSVQPPDSSVQVEENNPLQSNIAILVIKYSSEAQEVVTKVINGSETVQIGSSTCENIDGETACEVELIPQVSFDYEEMKWFDITFETTANDAISIDTFRIYIEDKNEAPISIQFGTDLMSVIENSQNQLLGHFFAVDPDISDNLTFTVSGNDNFIVTEAGMILTSPDAEIDFESDKYMAISVTVTDAGGLSFTQDFNVTVTDENELPSRLSLNNIKVPEMSPIGTEVGTLIVSDQDLEQNHSFELMTKEDNRFSIEGSKLLVGNEGAQCKIKGGTHCLLDFESQSEYNLTVRVIDNGTPTLAAMFTIKVRVTDVNDTPRSVSISANKIPEDTSHGSIVAVVQAFDDDVGQTLSFNISESVYFDIEGEHLILAKALDYETSTEHNITIIVTDDGIQPSTVSVQFVIHVINVNEAPFSMQLFSTAKSIETFDVDVPVILEDLPPLTYIGQIVVLDGDKEDKVQIKSINSDIVVRNVRCIPVSKGTRCTADVRSGRVFDYEREQILTITFIATDDGGLQLRREITLQIVDSNDPPTNIYLNDSETSEVMVPENSRNILIAKLTVEDKEEEQLHTYSLSGESSFLFISDDELWIASAAMLDYETKQEVKFTIRVTDNGTPSKHFVKDMILKIADVNEAPSALYITNNTIPETVMEGYEIGNIIVKDPENMNNAQTEGFSIVLPNTESLLRVEGNTLLVTSSKFDYETEKEYQEVVIVSDSGTPIMSSTFTISLEIIGVNEAPTQIDFVGTDSVKESVGVGETVGKFTARDPDNEQSLAFVILGTNLLSIDGDSVVVNGAIDYETVKELQFTAAVTDSGIPPLTLKKNFSLIITDVNEPPTEIIVVNNSDMTLSEGRSTDEPVVQLKIFDEDIVERLEAEIVYGMDLFRLAPTGLNCSMVADFTGKFCFTSLYLKKTIDFESDQRIIDISLKIQDKGGLTLQRTFSFSVTGVNEPPKDIIIENVTAFVPENSPNFLIGKLATIGDELYERFTYVVVSHWETFSVVWRQLITRPGLDYEKQDTYTVTIRSQDDGYSPQYLLKEFTILVGDINEAPSNIELIPTEIAKKASVGESVAKIHVTDPDNLGRPDFQNHSCEVSTDYFSVDNVDLVLMLRLPIADDIDEINVTITCTDTGIPALSTTFDFDIFIVENVNAPKEIQLYDASGSTNLSVNENTLDVAVGNLSVVNILSKETIRSTLEFGLSEKSQQTFTIIGETLILVKMLDFETLPITDVEVFSKGTDVTGDSFDIGRSFTVQVKDVNEAPTNVDIQGRRSVIENSEQGTVIGDLITYDSDNHQNYTYTLLGVSYGLRATQADLDMLNAFAIENGVLKVGKDVQFINYEKSNIIALLINTRDSGEPPYNLTGIVRLLVEDAIEPPTDIMLSNSEIPENSHVDTVIGTFSVVDEDGNQQQACEILNLIDVPFKISDLYHLVVANNILDFETRTSYMVQVSCGSSFEEGTNHKFTKTFVVNITNINEAPTDLTLSSNKVQENNQIGQIIAEIRAIDADSPLIMFSIEEKEDADLFQIEENSVLTANTVFDYETRIFFKVIIKATDNEGKHTEKEFELEILNMNEEPTEIKLDNQIASERTEPGSIVGRLTTLDPDRNQEFVYTLNKQYGSFDINGNALIVGETGVDFETTSSYKLTVLSVDNGTPPKSIQQAFIIDIQDANDPPKAILVDRLEVVPEDAVLGAVVASFQIDDPDVDQRHACNVIKGEEFISVLTEANADAKMILATKLNYEETDKLNIVMSCSDGEFGIEKEVEIYIGDVNEAPTSIKLSGSNTVLADATQNFVIGVFYAADEDVGQVHSFTISGQNSDILKISANNELILLDRIPAELLEDLDPSLKFTVMVDDDGTPVLTYNQSFKLPITDVEIPDKSLPEIAISFIELNNTMKKGDVISSLSPNNLTLPSSTQFTLVNNPYDIFSIENNTLLVLATLIESVDKSLFKLRIQVEDVETLEKETKIVEVLIEIYNTCFLSGQNCKENEMCVQHDTNHSCECIDGFSRSSDKICTEVGNCEAVGEFNNVSAHRCLNGGTCIDSITSYSCKCEDGFEGKHCEKEKDGSNACITNPCFNDGVCISDRGASSYHCSCEKGWTGLLCEVSVDECEDAKCLHGGTCLDEHLTFLCICDEARKGLRCEYDSEICIEKLCNKSHVCVGFTTSNRTTCLKHEKYIVELRYAKPDITNVRAFQARLVDFILTSGGLPLQTNPIDRRRRGSNPGELQIYVTDAVETEDKYIFSFVVIDANEEAFTKDAVLTILSETCRDMSSREVTETEFCPSIEQAFVFRLSASSQSRSTLGLITGVIVGVVVLVVLTLSIVIIWKKKKSNSVKPQEGVSQGDDLNSEGGYATMPMSGESDNGIQEAPAGDTPLAINTTVIQVAPASEDHAYTSVV